MGVAEILGSLRPVANLDRIAADIARREKCIQLHWESLIRSGSWRFALARRRAAGERHERQGPHRVGRLRHAIMTRGSRGREFPTRARTPRWSEGSLDPRTSERARYPRERRRAALRRFARASRSTACAQARHRAEAA